jgi:hypothetical protein
MIVLQVFGLGAAFVVALFYLGYGLARVLLPASFAMYRILLTPFVGMALVIVWDYLALFFGLELTRATWALTALATALNLFVFARHGRAHNASESRPAPPREQWLVLAFAFIAFLAAIAPLLRYGYVSVIGENWDYEFYLPLADYLRALPTAALVNAPPNPLRTTILSRHILPLPMGFSYLHATLNVLTQTQALDSFAIVLGVLRAMGVIAAYLFFRATFKMSARAAVIAAALMALNGLLLWFTYWSFGLHLAALPLSPIALMFGAHALMERGAHARSLLTVGFFLGALNVTYHPALVAVGLPLLAIGVHQFVTQKQRGEILLRGASIIALTLLFSFPTLFHIQDFLREYYGRAPLAIGLREFVPLSDGYGLSLYILDLAVGHTIPTPWLYEIITRVWDVGAPLLTFAAVLASLYALWQLRVDRERRAVWYLVVGASVFYTALFRLPFLRPYPYGFLKSLSLVSYVLLALVVQGIEFGIGGGRLKTRDWRLEISLQSLISILFLATFAFFTVLTFALSVEQYFKPRPAFFDADALRVRELSARIPNNAEIFLTDRAEAQKIPMGLAAYALLQNPLYGNVTTGYGELNNAEAGRVYDYALLARGEEPTTRGYQNNAVWANETFALYPRGQGVVTHTALNAQTVAPQPLTFTLGAQEIVSGTRTISTTQGVRDVTIALASFVPQSVEIALGKQTAQIELRPGLTIYTTANVALPATLIVTPTVAAEILDATRSTIPHQLPGADAALIVPYMQLAEARAREHSRTNAVSTLVRCTNENANDLSARCFVVNPNGETLTWRWIVRGTLAGRREERVMAQADVSGAPRERVDIWAMTRGGMGFQFDDMPPRSLATPAFPDGTYRGALEIFRADVLLARIPLYAFTVRENGSQLIRDTGASPAVILAP